MAQPRRSGGVSPLLEPALVLLALLFLQHLVQEATDDVISTPQYMPLYERTQALLDAPLLESLRAEALSHADSSTLSGAFGQTQGVVLRFNREGVQELNASQWAGLMPFFDAVADPQTNAYVLNVLIVPDGASVKLHVDNTVGIRSVTKYLAHSVSVLYLQVPKRMHGGRLELFHRYRSKSWTNPLNDHADASLTPAENMLVKFRGDAWHAIEEMQSADGQPRVSLVLEQYRIPAEAYPETITFAHKASEESEVNEFDMLQYVITQLSKSMTYLIVASGAWLLYTASTIVS